MRRWLLAVVWLAACSDGRRPELVVTRAMAGWCGTCQALATESASLLPSAQWARIEVRDVLLADEDNAPPSAEALARWRAQYGPVSAQTELPLRELFAARPLPWIVVQRDGEVLATLANPSADALRTALEDALEEPHSGEGSLADARFDVFEQALLRGMRLRDQLPAEPGNEVADDARAALLGRQLFFDSSLSSRGVSCGGCHDPSLLMTDGKGVPPEGAERGRRNVPSNALASRARWQLWDGRADALWNQALLPFEDPTEFASSRLFVVRAVAAGHGEPYRALFGELPDLARLPPAGKPGDPAWTSMTPADQQAVTRAFFNVGKSLAAFERSIVVAPNALDRYLDGDPGALTGEQKDGLLAFLRSGCAQCHHGERLSDDAFHNLRFPTGRGDAQPDLGRAQGLEELSKLEQPADPARVATATRAGASLASRGAFKTPGLRGVAYTLPYGHGGAYGGLTSVIEAHRSCGLPAESPLTTGDCETWVQGFDASRIPSIVAFLRSLELELSGHTPL